MHVCIPDVYLINISVHYYSGAIMPKEIERTKYITDETQETDRTKYIITDKTKEVERTEYVFPDETKETEPKEYTIDQQFYESSQYTT